MATVTPPRVGTVDSFIAALGLEARDNGLDADEAAACTEATRRRFVAYVSESADSRMRRRLRAYFEGVVRGRAMRSRGARMATVRHNLVLASIAEDLAAANASHDRIVMELHETYPGSVPSGVIEQIARRAVERVAS